MKTYILLLLFPVLLCACNDWLDVKPDDRISEDATFSTPQGFQLALNGVYIDLNVSNLYGQALTWDFVEILAQRYAISKSTTYNREAMQFHFKAEEVKGRVSPIWAKAYGLIANINLILENCEERREVISDEYYALIKGEALGLRALLHFDLFRLWGPVYTTANEEQLTIPYYDEFALAGQPKQTAKAFMTHVVSDLEEAAILLQDDPIKTAATPLTANTANPFYGFRALRMNYYAVRLLAARAYLYMNDLENAYTAAREVVDVQEMLFPWTTKAQLAIQEDQDRMFSSELVFALQNSNRKSIYTKNFDAENLKLGALLVPASEVIKKIFPTNEEGDARYTTWLSDEVDLESSTYKKFKKYQALSDTLYSQLIPMLRVSEAYYILAECEAENDKEAGLSWLNKVRNARSLKNNDWDYFEDVLESEYMREFFGEGQLFYFYKRRKYEKIQDAYEADASVTMDDTQYVLEIPEEESKYN